MTLPDASSPRPPLTSTKADPVWLQKIVELLRTHLPEIEPHERVQFTFNRCGDQVAMDYSIKSIKL